MAFQFAWLFVSYGLVFAIAAALRLTVSVFA